MSKSLEIKETSYIPKLNGDNYIIWKHHILLLFKLKKLLPVIFDENEDLEALSPHRAAARASLNDNNAENESIEQFDDINDKNTLAMIYITSTVDDRRLELIINCETAA